MASANRPGLLLSDVKTYSRNWQRARAPVVAFLQREPSLFNPDPVFALDKYIWGDFIRDSYFRYDAVQGLQVGIRKNASTHIEWYRCPRPTELKGWSTRLLQLPSYDAGELAEGAVDNLQSILMAIFYDLPFSWNTEATADAYRFLIDNIRLQENEGLKRRKTIRSLERRLKAGIRAMREGASDQDTTKCTSDVALEDNGVQTRNGRTLLSKPLTAATVHESTRVDDPVSSGGQVRKRQKRKRSAQRLERNKERRKQKRQQRSISKTPGRLPSPAPSDDSITTNDEDLNDDDFDAHDNATAIYTSSPQRHSSIGADTQSIVSAADTESAASSVPSITSREVSPSTPSPHSSAAPSMPAQRTIQVFDCVLIPRSALQSRVALPPCGRGAGTSSAEAKEDDDMVSTIIAFAPKCPLRPIRPRQSLEPEADARLIANDNMEQHHMPESKDGPPTPAASYAGVADNATGAVQVDADQPVVGNDAGDPRDDSIVIDLTTDDNNEGPIKLHQPGHTIKRHLASRTASAHAQQPFIRRPRRSHPHTLVKRLEIDLSRLQQSCQATRSAVELINNQLPANGIQVSFTRKMEDVVASVSNVNDVVSIPSFDPNTVADGNAYKWETVPLNERKYWPKEKEGRHRTRHVRKS